MIAYSDKLDGRIQVSFSLPVATDKSRAKALGELYCKRLGLTEVLITSVREVGSYTCYVAYGNSAVSVDLDEVVSEDAEFTCRSKDQIEKEATDFLRPDKKVLTVVGAALESDAHTVGLDAILNPPYGKSWASEQKYIKDGKDVIDARFQIRLKNYWGIEEEADAIPRSSDGQLLFLMEMVSKMKPLSQSPTGTRIASVHNGSSLFTGDAGGGESNIRRYIIENDWLEAIVQLPNNLFYNTGITTYIWILSNNKAANRKGKVQLIDAGQLYRKLRKNLGNKNCELAPENISEIVKTYTELAAIERASDDSIAAKVFDNSDFGYHKVTIERPKRLKAQFTVERIAELSFDKSLKEAMVYAYETFGESIYTTVEHYKKEILDWCEKNELNLTAANQKKLVAKATWEKQAFLLEQAQILLDALGDEIYTDFNLFKQKVEAVIKDKKLKLGASEKNAILNAVSWYDAEAEKVFKATVKLSGDKLATLLEHFNCTESELPNYGYYPTNKKGEYLTYETESDLRDIENVPLKEDIHTYFLREVQPHVAEAWINLDATKIGYEISFNKYFYQHKPLRAIEAVTADILALEKESDGLIAEILNF
jgi:type I restriction enzyme M protein